MTTAFYEALDRARQDPTSAEPGSEMAKLAARMKPGSRIAGITLGEDGANLTPEDIAREINRSMDHKGRAFSTFAASTKPDDYQWTGPGPEPSRWTAPDGAIVYRSYEDYCDD